MKKDKGAAVGLVICFVAMIAIVGAITFSNYERKSEGELAKTEEIRRCSNFFLKFYIISFLSMGYRAS